MENPAHWNEIEKLIYATMQKSHKLLEEGVIGYSTPRRIYLALKEAGYLKEEA